MGARFTTVREEVAPDAPIHTRAWNQALVTLITLPVSQKLSPSAACNAQREYVVRRWLAVVVTETVPTEVKSLSSPPTK
jgi:hypothetical protein